MGAFVTVCKMIEVDPFAFAQWCEKLGLSMMVTPESTIHDLALQYIAQRGLAV